MNGSPPPPCRVILVDDTPSVREALRLVFEGEEDMEIVGEAAGSVEALRLAEALQPDVIVLDYWLPGTTGSDLVPLLRERAPRARAVILTIESGMRHRKAALAVGADAYLLKTMPAIELFQTIRRLLHA